MIPGARAVMEAYGFRALKDDPVARTVKLADLSHNSDRERCKLADEPEERTESRMKKYEKAIQILSEE